jgi:hypothetical protein
MKWERSDVFRQALAGFVKPLAFARQKVLQFVFLAVLYAS